MTGASHTDPPKETTSERKKRNEEEDRIRKEAVRRRKEEDRIRRESKEERIQREADAARIKKASEVTFAEDETGGITRVADGTFPAFPGGAEMADKGKLGREENVGLKRMG